MKPSKLQVGATHLVASAAKYHNLTVPQLLSLHKYNPFPGPPHPQPQFFICSMMLIERALTLGKTLDEVGLPVGFLSLVETETSMDVDLESKFSSYELAGCSNYRYLYETISLIINTKARRWADFPGVHPLKPTVVTVPETPKPTIIVPEDEDFPSIVSPIPIPEAMNIKWNAQQNQAFKMIFAWLRRKDRKQVFRLYGYAGTGKTVMSKEVARFVYEEMGKNNVPTGEVLYTAYTGKACSVLRSKGCDNADTLHSLLYKAEMDEETGKILRFSINQLSPIKTASLVVLDEASFVDNEMAADLLSFGTPVLVLGDPAQLPPVKGEGAMTDEDPDFMLTDIERQAAENPIIYLATLVRNGEYLKAGRYGDTVVYPNGTSIEGDMLRNSDQCLVGLNNTRKTINRRMRRSNGKADIDPIYPVKGDRLICLKNNKLNGLYNGTLWTASQPIITKVMKPIVKGSTILKMGDADVLAFKVRGIDEMDRSTGKPIIVNTQCSLHLFNDQLPEPDWREVSGTDQYDFGYGITVHKSQGSQWDSVLLVDESASFREMRYRHLYTGITRAAKQLSLILTS